MTEYIQQLQYASLYKFQNWWFLGKKRKRNYETLSRFSWFTIL